MAVLTSVVEVVGDHAAFDGDVLAVDVDRGASGVVVHEISSQSDVAALEHQPGGLLVGEIQLKTLDDPVLARDRQQRFRLVELDHGPGGGGWRPPQHVRRSAVPLLEIVIPGAVYVVGAGSPSGCSAYTQIAFPAPCAGAVAWMYAIAWFTVSHGLSWVPGFPGAPLT